MKVTIENTNRTVHLNGLPTRIWTGTSESGVSVQMFVALVAVPGDADASVFDAELMRRAAPTEEGFPLRLVL